MDVFLFAPGSTVYEFDKLVAGGFGGGCGHVSERRVRVGPQRSVYVQCIVPAPQQNLAGGIDGAIERKFRCFPFRMEYPHIVGVEAEVVGQLFELPVVQRTVYQPRMPFHVGYLDIVEVEMPRTDVYRVGMYLKGGVQDIHFHAGVCPGFPFQVEA